MSLDIIIFALIAAFLVYRLRNVLGKRHGSERQRTNPITAREQASASRRQGGDQRDGAEAGGDNVVPLPGAQSKPRVPQDDDPVSQGIRDIQATDPAFDPDEFLQGAQAAFGMIVEAYAQGDHATLRSLLSDDVFQAFEGAIQERERAGETLETRIEDIQSIDLVEASLRGRIAYVTVKIVSHQINVTRDSDGGVVDGDPDNASEVTDLWTFERDTASDDPNWALSQTRSPEG